MKTKEFGKAIDEAIKEAYGSWKRYKKCNEEMIAMTEQSLDILRKEW